MARTTISSLNVQRSSRLPPPRAITITLASGDLVGQRDARRRPLGRPRALDAQSGRSGTRRTASDGP